MNKNLDKLYDYNQLTLHDIFIGGRPRHPFYENTNDRIFRHATERWVVYQDGVVYGLGTSKNKAIFNAILEGNYCPPNELEQEHLNAQRSIGREMAYFVKHFNIARCSLGFIRKAMECGGDIDFIERNEAVYAN
jgi:hypothetical protein